MEHIKKFQELLRELFQFDCADLDFGIYRIMNYKRDVIEEFIQEKLPKAIAHELEQGALAGQSQAAKGLEAAKKKILEALGDEALDVSGVLNEQYHSTKAGKEYLAALEKAKSAKGREALEATIYNHLYTFFNRYYQDGDFISKRRYSKRERYAIPYNGEEVMLYWANHDQYYIKTGEYFTDYTWKATSGVTVHFKLTAADVEQNNVKGDKRFFLPQLGGIAWDESAQSLTIPFEFRPLNGQEAITYAGKSQQETIIAKAVENIPKQRPVKSAPLALAALDAEKRRNKEGESVTYLEHHLRYYIRGNTSDFFIHKDLKGFLSRELDFYLKNEVLNLDEMDAAGVDLSEGWFQMMRLIKKVGGHIIAFLAQIEEFQKMLWEKRKFVTETFYCITMINIPEEFYPEIAACEAQWEEWKTLLRIDEEDASRFTAGKGKKDRRMEFLKTHPTLVLDTRHFTSGSSTGSGQYFTDRLLASFEDINEVTDGLLVNSENWQALRLLLDSYSENIQCIYIDPPYNTGNDEFIYKDSYQHSSWLTQIDQVMSVARSLMSKSSAFFASCDDNEINRFRELLDALFGIENFESQIIIQSNKRGQTYKSIAKTHEYLLVYDGDENTKLNGLPRDIENGDEDQYGHYELWELRNRNPKFGRFNRPNLFFPIYVSEKEYNDNSYSCVSVTKTKDMPIAVYPKNSAGEDSCWRWSSKKVESASQLGDQILIAKKTRTDEWRVFEKSRKSFKAPKSIWFDTKVINEQGTTALGNMGFKNFGFPKPIGLIELVVQIGLSETDTTLDFFAGTGTTGHAIINLNRQDQGERKFILVEMADYFDTVLLPRIKKVTFSPEWKDGKPKRMATAEEAERSPRIVKVIRLESYEDALNNIAFDDPSGQQAMQFEDYLLQYMLKWETRHSETLLNVEQLTKPFSYQLHIHRDGETRTQAVDLPETFAYLLGLNVRKRFVLNDTDRRYLVCHGDTREGRKVAVIWRETEGWKEKDYARDKAFVAKQQLTEGVDDVYVNGDSYIPGARALEPLFKARMFADVEA